MHYITPPSKNIAGNASPPGCTPLTVFEISVKKNHFHILMCLKKLNKFAERFPLITAWHLIQGLANLEINRVGACELTLTRELR